MRAIPCALPTLRAGTRRPHSADERGVTLIECLVAVAILTTVVLGIAQATTTASNASTSVSRSQRLSVALTAYGEALKNLPYRPCPVLPTQYQADLTASQAALSADQQVDQVASATFHPALTVDSAVSSCDSGQTDSGTQLIGLTVTAGSMRRSGTIVKRDPSTLALQARVVIGGGPGHQYPTPGYAPNRTSAQFDPIQTWALSGVGSWAPTGIYAYQYTCDVNDPTSVAHPILTYQSYDPADVCAYPAAAYNSSPLVDPYGYHYRNVTLQLTVFDKSTPAIASSATYTVAVYDLQAAAPTLDASFTASALNITAPATVVFTPTGSSPIVEWDWDFGDSSYTGSNGTSVCTGTATFCASTSHQFTTTPASPPAFPLPGKIAGQFVVTLTVRNAAGQTGRSSQSITVNPPAVPKPIPSFTLTPSAGVAPQTVKFDATASTTANGTPLGSVGAATFGWAVYNSLGVQVSSGIAPTVKSQWLFPGAGTFVVVLTVTDGAGGSATLSRSITLGALAPPTAVATSNAVAHFFGGASVVVSWTDAPQSPGDVVKYDVQIQNSNPSCAFGLFDLNTSGGGSLIPATTSVPPVQSAQVSVGNGLVSILQSGFCNKPYQVRVKTYRTNSDGSTFTSDWSAPAFFSNFRLAA